MTSDETADHVVAAARRERNDEAYLPVRVFVGGSAGGQCQQHRAGFQEPRSQTVHRFPSLRITQISSAPLNRASGIKSLSENYHRRKWRARRDSNSRPPDS